jgi:hypothetical protein
MAHARLSLNAESEDARRKAVGEVTEVLKTYLR